MLTAVAAAVAGFFSSLLMIKMDKKSGGQCEANDAAQSTK